MRRMSLLGGHDDRLTPKDIPTSRSSLEIPKAFYLYRKEEEAKFHNIPPTVNDDTPDELLCGGRWLIPAVADDDYDDDYDDAYGFAWYGDEHNRYRYRDLLNAPPPFAAVIDQATLTKFGPSFFDNSILVFAAPGCFSADNILHDRAREYSVEDVPNRRDALPAEYCALLDYPSYITPYSDTDLMLVLRLNEMWQDHEVKVRLAIPTCTDIEGTRFVWSYKFYFDDFTHVFIVNSFYSYNSGEDWHLHSFKKDKISDPRIRKAIAGYAKAAILSKYRSECSSYELYDPHTGKLLSEESSVL